MQKIHLLFLLLFVAPIGCTVPGPSEPVAQIAFRQNQWQQHNIRHYRISVMKTQATFHTQTNTITVQDGQITDQTATCTPAPSEGRECKVRPFDPEEFTVEGLFKTALKYAPESAKYQLRVTFDDTYSYPTTISRDEKKLVDDENFWRVISFDQLQ